MFVLIVLEFLQLCEDAVGSVAVIVSRVVIMISKDELDSVTRVRGGDWLWTDRGEGRGGEGKGGVRSTFSTLWYPNSLTNPLDLNS